MNWICAIGIIPFVYLCKSTLTGSNKAFKELCRCMDHIHSRVDINQGEMMNGGTTIRAVGSQEYAEKCNETGQDAYVLHSLPLAALKLSCLALGNGSVCKLEKLQSF
jgi:hypothetical protein